jgi:plasmid stabilization system protein ParE
MRLVYAARALRDIDEILAYIHERNPQAARNVSLAIEQTISLCALIPYAGARTDEHNVYRHPLARYPYTIFYRVDPGNDVLQVARVIHGARIKELGQVPDDT